MPVLRILGYNPAVLYLRDKLVHEGHLPAHYCCELIPTRHAYVAALVCWNSTGEITPHDLAHDLFSLISTAAGLGVAVGTIESRKCGFTLASNAVGTLPYCERPAFQELCGIAERAQFERIFSHYVPAFETCSRRDVIRMPTPSPRVVQSTVVAIAA